MSYTKTVWADGVVGGVPITAVRLNNIENQIEELSNDLVISVTTAGLFGPYRQIAHSLPSPRNDAVIVGASANMVGAGDLAMPGHAIGYLARARWVSGTVGEIYGVEGRVDHEGATAVITQGTAFLAIAGSNTDNLGTMTLFEGVRFPDFSGASYSRITNRVAYVNDDPGAMTLSRGRILGPYGRQRNALSKVTYSGGEVAPPPHSGLATGVRYSSPMTVGAADAAIGANLIYYVPVYVSERITLDKLGFRVTTAGAASTVARMGIWPWARGVLGDKIAESPEVAVDSTGDKEATVAGSVTLEAGLYGLGIISNGTPSISWLTDYTLGGVIGTTNTAHDDTLVFQVQTYGAMPTTPSITRATNSGWINPFLWLTRA